MSAAPLFDVTVTRSGREEHVLRLGDDEPASAEIEEATAMQSADEALVGISAEDLHRVAVDAELEVCSFEEREKRVLDFEPFLALQRFVIQADLDRNSLIEIPEDALESIPELTPEELEALDEKALDEIILKSPKLESVPALTPEERKVLDFLTEIIRRVPLALACWRVQVALGMLRELRVSFPGEVLPDELADLLRRVGAAVSEPTKDTDLANLERREAILAAWKVRASLTRDERENLAGRLGYGYEAVPGSGWASIARLARKYRRTEAE